MTDINLIVAYAKNNVIGNQGSLPWSIPSDLAYFKETTMHSPIIMGRVTWESLGRPLPGRLNIVITSNRDYSADGAVVVKDLNQAIEVAKSQEPEKAIFIIGGGQIYAKALETEGLVKKVYATEIHNTVDGDTFFPALDEEEWREVSRQPQPLDNDFDFDFVIYERR